ncbi:LST8 protein, partial [Piaya cayana]|nr:LST8 protein [Piaya cayana]
MNAAQGTVGSDPVILATAGYDHTVRFWQAHSGICTRTVQHQDSVSATLGALGRDEGDREGMGWGNRGDDVPYSRGGGADCGLLPAPSLLLLCRSRNLQCQRIFQVNAPINCVCLHPNQAELIVGDQSGAIHIWDLKTDHNEQLIPEPEVSVNSVHIDPDASYMAAVNSSGNCYVWNLTGGIGEEVTQLIPKTKIPAHNRYALQCKFSPDST